MQKKCVTTVPEDWQVGAAFAQTLSKFMKRAVRPTETIRGLIQLRATYLDRGALLSRATKHNGQRVGGTGPN